MMRMGLAMVKAAAMAMVLSACAGAGEVPINRSGDWRADVRALARDNFRHPAWGFRHAERDYRLAKALAERDSVPLDDDILYAAAYLHDIAMFAPWSSITADHADHGANVIVSILKQTSFPEAKIEAVQAAVRTHMYDRAPEGPEAIYLHDADALDWLGSIGIVRFVANGDRKGGEEAIARALASAEKQAGGAQRGIVSASGKAEAQARLAEGQRLFEPLRDAFADRR